MEGRVRMRRGLVFVLACLLAGVPAVSGRAQGAGRGQREQVILDTDIGDDIDDAFALGLALSDRRVELLGVTTGYGDTRWRAALAARFLKETGHGDVPVFAGRSSAAPAGQMTQARWARGGTDAEFGEAVRFLRDTIEAHPGQVTLIAIGPETNLGDLIRQYPATFRKLKRVVLMGGSVYAGYGDLGYKAPHGRDAEWNIKVDPAAAKLVFGSGVPLFVMPLDATQSKIDEVKRGVLFGEGTPLTDALAVLYHLWSSGTGQVTPTAFDVVAVAYALDPAVCPAVPMRLEVDDRGFTVPVAGVANVQVCLRVSEDRLFPLMMGRLLRPETGSH